MEIVIKNILVTLAAFIAMEAVAWLTHKYIMHGLLWKLHKDHHKKDSYGFFERNDFFFLIFALPGMTALYFGMQANYNFLFFIGLGITLYGFTYFLVHEIFIHQRFKFFRNTDYTYFKAIRRAHKVHHKHLDKEDGECFGMLWVPMKFFRDIKSKTPA
ncbi:sterol desaturase family protein [Segetibacter aerophilus]|uniref:Beta-carotene hydroxylase n=1 Tax=Segetibacter aerophilus TaxID=670293 RepID=A0A512BH54_9BACT|nr:sterol desaturase family protein [Segetibacter aerophilus]GEO11289.1 beta-carotene hydroxylase [Segetibacter aerophilus]